MPNFIQFSGTLVALVSCQIHEKILFCMNRHNKKQRQRLTVMTFIISDLKLLTAY